MDKSKFVVDNPCDDDDVPLTERAWRAFISSAMLYHANKTVLHGCLLLTTPEIFCSVICSIHV